MVSYVSRKEAIKIHYVISGTELLLFLAMGSFGNPKPWVPYVNTNDCSQQFCSIYCPQWCYIIFPPPPPPLEISVGSSGPNFSPLVIAIIGILASALLLVSYYAIISKYCGNINNSSRSRRRDPNRDPNEELEDNTINDDPSTNHEPWIVPSTTTGLEEAFIKSIAVCKYKKGDGLVEGTDCSVCLIEFQDDERLRLLPKCSHAFHVTCIDTWLKSHSNCPLCRANIACVNASPVIEAPPDIIVAEILESPVVHEVVDIEMDARRVQEDEIISQSVIVFPKTEFMGLSLTGRSPEEAPNAIIEIREEEEDGRLIRRSVSMDYSCQGRVFPVADVIQMKQGKVFEAEEECQGDVGSSKQPSIEIINNCSHRSRVLHCVMSPAAVMKRSLSSGRFSLSMRSTGRNIILPL